jgi:formylglycine-generating enzyme required for sulfatase activity
LSQIYGKKWFDSDTFSMLSNNLSKERCYVEKREYTIGNQQVCIGDFFISTTLLENQIVMQIMNALDLKNKKDGTYFIFNEFNPSLPLYWDEENRRYSIRTGYENHPVSGITWQGALLMAFLLGGRLPFELEWEVCATSGDLGRKYPWGSDDPSVQYANYGEHVGSTTPVKSYPPTPWGLFDMAGNVEEWCVDWYYPHHSYTAHDPVPGVETHSEKTVKGGSWNKNKDLLLCRSRRGKWYRIGTVGIGVRVLWEEHPMEVIPWLEGIAAGVTHM